MRNANVTLRGQIRVPPDRLEAIRAALPEHIRLTRAEPGCLRFDVTEDPDQPGRFDVTEQFTDAQAFRAHQDRARSAEWGRISAGIPRDYVIEGLDG